MSAERELDSMAGVLLRLADDVMQHSGDRVLHAMARLAVREIPDTVQEKAVAEHLNELGVAIAEGWGRLVARHERILKLLAHAAAGKEGI